uniref:RRM domain-containing protein n=1 Tax=Eutreptiella gymnastica TaxID=73025 RepID=A0A7S4FFN2_9EUGL
MEVVIMRDRVTGRHRGCAFVTYGSRDEADAAIRALNGQHIIRPQTHALQVRYADSAPALVSGQPPTPNVLGLGMLPGLFPGLPVFPPFAGLGAIPLPPRQAKKINHPSRGGRKLFVGQFPRHTTMEELQNIFAEYGTVDEVFLFKDRVSGQGRGAAFVLFAEPASADAAIEGLHNKRILPPLKTFLQVKHADGEVPPFGDPKLFVGMIPFRATEEDVRDVFQQYGTLVEVTVLHKRSGQRQGAGFVRYENREQCDAAIEALDGKVRMPGSPNPLTVRYAAASKSKTTNKQPMQQQLQQQQQQAVWLQAYVQQLGASAAVAAAVAAASGVNPLAAAQQAYFGGLGGFPGVPNPPVLPQKKQSPGPPGANLFILHLPFDWGENELRGAFAPFGPIMSAMVFIDRVTGLSKGFGFVSYNNPAHASAAIAAMNGYQIGNERLLVQLKTEREPPAATH